MAPDEGKAVAVLEAAAEAEVELAGAVMLTVAGHTVVKRSMVCVTTISFWYEAGQLTTLAAQLVMVYVVVLYTVEVTSSSPVEVPAGVDELLMGYLKLEEGREDCSAEPVAVDGGGVVTPVPENTIVVREEIVSCALLSLNDGRRETVAE